MRDKKGQNMAEYVLLVTSVVMVCIYFYYNKSGSAVMPTSVNATLSSMVNQVNNINSQMQFPS